MTGAWFAWSAGGARAVGYQPTHRQSPQDLLLVGLSDRGLAVRLGQGHLPLRSIAVNGGRVSAERSTDDERILRASRTKWLANLLFFAAGEDILLILAIIVPKHPISWALIVIFGVGVFMSFVELLPGTTYLRLTPEGYEQRAHFRTSKQSWQHIERFQTFRLPVRWKRYVGIIFDPSYKSDTRARRLSPSPVLTACSATTMAWQPTSWPT